MCFRVVTINEIGINTFAQRSQSQLLQIVVRIFWICITALLILENTDRENGSQMMLANTSQRCFKHLARNETSLCRSITTKVDRSKRNLAACTRFQTVQIMIKSLRGLSTFLLKHIYGILIRFWMLLLNHCMIYTHIFIILKESFNLIIAHSFHILQAIFQMLNKALVDKRCKIVVNMHGSNSTKLDLRLALICNRILLTSSGIIGGWTNIAIASYKAISKNLVKIEEQTVVFTDIGFLKIMLIQQHALMCCTYFWTQSIVKSNNLLNIRSSLFLSAREAVLVNICICVFNVNCIVSSHNCLYNFIMAISCFTALISI